MMMSLLVNPPDNPEKDTRDYITSGMKTALQ